MPYRSKIRLTIYTLDRSLCSMGSKIIEMPFAPFTGLQISFGGAGPFQIVSVIWDAEENAFYCRIEEAEFRSGGDFFDIEYLIKEAKELGFDGFRRMFEVGDT